MLVLGIRESEHEVVAAAEAGACGYVAHDRSIGDLVAAVERAARGEVVCPPRIVGCLFRRIGSLASERGEPAGFAELTAREREVIELVGQGLSNKEIARRLGIRLATVKNHVHNSLGKLGVRRRSAVAALLRRHHTSV